MGDTVQIADLKRAISSALVPASYTGVVGTGSTTTQVVDSVGGWQANQWQNWGIQFTQNTLTPALRGVWQQITGNTANTLTLAAALPAAPAAGDTYDIRPFGSQVQDVAAWGGQAVAAPQGDADGVAASASGLPVFIAHLVGWTGTVWNRLKILASGALQVRDDATSATGATAPSVASLVGGSDGTNLRAIKTLADGTVAMTTTPVLANSVPSGTSAAATTPLLLNYGVTKAHYSVTANGTINVAVALNTATTFSVSHNANAATPSYNTFNGGQNLAANSEYRFSLPVAAGDVIDFEVGAAATINVLEVFFQETQ